MFRLCTKLYTIAFVIIVSFNKNKFEFKTTGLTRHCDPEASGEAIRCFTRHCERFREPSLRME